MVDDARSRILAATVVCLGRFGLAKTTVDDVATEAGLARATVYRHVPDGRDQLIAEAIEWAVAEFFADLAAAVADAPDFATALELALLHGHRAVDEHEVLQKVLETEPERLLPQMAQSAPLVLQNIRTYLAERLRDEPLQPGVDPDEAAAWLARMVLSFISSGGQWDLSDPVAVRHLVRDELLAGVLAHRDRGHGQDP